MIFTSLSKTYKDKNYDSKVFASNGYQNYYFLIKYLV